MNPEDDLSPALGTGEPPSFAPELGNRPGHGKRPWWRNLKGPISVLLADLEAETPMVRRRAAEALVRLGDRRAVPALVERSRDAHWEVRRACIEALTRLGGDGMLQALHRACQDGHPLVRLAAAEGVARHGDSSSREVLTQLAAYVGSYGTLADRKAIAEAQRRLEERLGRSG